MARQDKPTGGEIVEKVKKTKFQKDKTMKASKNGKRANFTPANLDHIKGIEDIENGVVIGELENENIVGEKTGSLPPGKYNLFIVGYESGWELYCTGSNGEIMGNADKAWVQANPIGSKSENEFYIQNEVVSIILGVAGLIVSIFGVFRWW